jgi:hypothetical protein
MAAQSTDTVPATPGRSLDPQGGRVHNISFKISIPEAEALIQEKNRMESDLESRGLLESGGKLTVSQFARARLFSGGEPLKVDYPAAPLDTRRAKRGSRPRPDKNPV